MRTPPAIRAATAADRPALIATLADAFADDPAMAWIFPDAAARPARLERFFGLISRADLRLDLAHVALDAGGQILGAALWRPPGGWHLPAAVLVMNLPRLVTTFGTALPRTLGLMGAMDAQHDRRMHWYLQFVGVARRAQGRGVGGALLKAGLARARADGGGRGMGCYLETATPSNVGLYQAHGFAVRNQWQHGSAPGFWSMWHPPQEAG